MFIANAYDETNNILDKEKKQNNGRMSMNNSQPSTTALFDMQEKINIRDKSTKYRETFNDNMEDNVLSRAFFSEKNVQIIQNGIRAGVYEKSKQEIVVPPQNKDNLKVIMRNTYSQYAQQYPNDITGQIEKLNKIILDYAINNVYNSAVSYMQYLHDQDTIAMPMDRPLQNDRDYKQLERKSFM
tara:strand:+ start:338 stop:889 length:552 start_codon:yes stop_codon:yes gene_type:complete